MGVKSDPPRLQWAIAAERDGREGAGPAQEQHVQQLREPQVRELVLDTGAPEAEEQSSQELQKSQWVICLHFLIMRVLGNDHLAVFKGLDGEVEIMYGCNKWLSW